ncbi:pentapeptide repeat-containing protein [Catellatospora bangladeshensis]|uniref:pentapeptide repeat-containing protein n=1 Tax=Catellatospora bangladeshensis TaxID=310355 RepID=UPI0036083705
MARAGIRDGRWDGPGGAEARFAEAEVSGVDFREARIGLFAAYHSTFEDCDFTGARFAATHFGLTGAGEGQWDGRRWPQTVYRRCDFTRVRFPTGNTFWGNARFEQCLFDRAKLRGMSFTHEAEFVACTFRGKIQDVNFWGGPPTGSRRSDAIAMSSPGTTSPVPNWSASPSGTSTCGRSGSPGHPGTPCWTTCQTG